MKALVAILALILALLAGVDAAMAADPKAVATIRADKRDCPGCDLADADLTNTCVKGGNLTGANFDRVNAVQMCMSNANFTRVTFRNADLSGANLSNSKLDGADLTGARLEITSIKGADLARARGLTQKQLDQACGDAATKLPAGLKVKACL